MVRLRREVADVVEREQLQRVEIICVLKEHPEDVGNCEGVKGSDQQCEEEIIALVHL